MKRIVYGLIVVLVVIHQDWWWWDDSETLVFGFLPIGLFYHALLSLAAGGAWWLAVVFCWPRELDSLEGAEAAVAEPEGVSS